MRIPLLLVALVATPLAVQAVAATAPTAPPPTSQDDAKPVQLAEGDAAPLTRLNDQDGKAATIGGDHSEENSDWTVVAFFPKAATPG